MVPTLTTFPSLTTVVRVGKVVKLGKSSGSEKDVRLGNLDVRLGKWSQTRKFGRQGRKKLSDSENSTMSNSTQFG